MFVYRCVRNVETSNLLKDTKRKSKYWADIIFLNRVMTLDLMASYNLFSLRVTTTRFKPSFQNNKLAMRRSWLFFGGGGIIELGVREIFKFAGGGGYKRNLILPESGSGPPPPLPRSANVIIYAFKNSYMCTYCLSSKEF